MHLNRDLDHGDMSQATRRLVALTMKKGLAKDGDEVRLGK